MKRIETMPFFKSFAPDGAALVDPEAFDRWLEALDQEDLILTPGDAKAREQALADSVQGKTLDLEKAMRQW